MIEALINGKLSREQENMEDMLTSIFFGLLKYVPIHEGILPFLSFAHNVDLHKLPIDLSMDYNIQYEFWPLLNDYKKSCEPDILIELSNSVSTLLILIEVKYNSGKSSISDNSKYVNDQLAREYMNLKLRAEKQNSLPFLIYMTKDVYIPKKEILTSIEELSDKEIVTNPNIFWISWRHITQLQQRNPIISDLIYLTKERLHLFFFNGFTVSDELTEINWSFNQQFD